jgi:nitrate/TMAO reductase-like tetraheme cytochrome c subunit
MLATLTIVLAALLAAAVLFRPTLLTTHGGLAFGFAALFVLPMLATGMGASAHVEHSKTTAYCTSCHVMENYGRSLLVDDLEHIPAKHFQNGRVPHEAACYACHTTYTMYGDFSSKLRGLHHVYVQYLGHIPEKLKLYGPYNNRECLHCHEGTRGLAETSAHHEPQDALAKMRRNELSCLASGCHAVTHDVGALAKLKVWNPKETP